MAGAQFGIVAPAGTPRKVVVQLHADVMKILRDPKIKEAFDRQGAEPAVDSSPEAFTSLLKSEHVRYQKLVREVGIKPQ